MGRTRTTEPSLLLKGTRTAMSFVREARDLAQGQPFPEAGQAAYSVMSDVLARAVLFANWEVVGAAALVRAGDVVRVTELGLVGPFRTDEFARRLTWRLLADAAHDLTETPVIEDAWGAPLEISRFVARRVANRAEDNAMAPTPIGPLTIPVAPELAARILAEERGHLDGLPRAPRSVSL